MRTRLPRTSPHFRRRASLVALALVALFASQADAQRRERLVENWRPTHYDVALVFNRDLSEVTRAETKISVTVLKDSLPVVDLDFGEMPVDGVSVNDRPARYERPAGRLDVFLPQPARRGEQIVVTVTYHGRPKDGLILTRDKDGNPSATGDNWPDRVHNWIPSLDHPSAKATVSFAVTIPSAYIAEANGHFKSSRDNGDGSRMLMFDESAPIPPYCMIVAVGTGGVAIIPSPHVPNNSVHSLLSYYVPSSDAQVAEKGFGAAAPSLAYFSRLVAPFPYEKLDHIVGATRYGGMENASAIVYASTLLDPRPNEPVSRRFGVRRGLVEVVAHETAHQWFGDAVTPATWADLWLSEGFATYFAGLFVERYEGEAAFRDYMSRAADAYLRYEKTRRTPIYDRDTENLNQLLNANNYQKGAWVLHMLRARLGDDAFFRGIRDYYHAHKDANATTEDLRAALERASGKDLREFFARWVYGSGHPAYRADWEWRPSRGAHAGGVIALALVQEQSGELFREPVPVEIVSAGGRVRRITVRSTGIETTVLVPLTSRAVAVRIDPDATILKEVLTKPEGRISGNGF
ncbi:MAG: M1 family metallopeptidase [Pyrinomonadaceae bacterium]